MVLATAALVGAASCSSSEPAVNAGSSTTTAAVTGSTPGSVASTSSTPPDTAGRASGTSTPAIDSTTTSTLAKATTSTGGVTTAPPSTEGPASTVASNDGEKAFCARSDEFVELLTTIDFTTKPELALSTLKQAYGDLNAIAPPAIAADMKTVNDAVQAAKDFQALEVAGEGLDDEGERLDAWTLAHCGHRFNSTT